MTEKIYLDKILYDMKPSKHEGETEEERQARKKAKKLRKKGISASKEEALDDMFKDIKREKKQARKEQERLQRGGLFYDPNDIIYDDDFNW